MNPRLTLLLIFIVCSNLVFGQSVLSQGEWHKLAVTEKGIYKIDFNFLKNTMGVNPSSIDPQTIKIFGHGGGGMLPQENNQFRYSDPPENKIFVSGESDGQFNESDFVLFFGHGPDKETFNSEGTFEHEKNLYCDTTYYFLTIGGEKGKRLSTNSNYVGTTTSVTTFDDYIYYEQDDYNILGSGREWVSWPYGTGKASIGESSSHNYNIPGLIGDANLDMKLIGASEFVASFDIYANSSPVAQVPVEAISQERYSDRAFEYPITSQLASPGESISILVYFNKNDQGGNSRGYLDYFTITFQRTLQLYGSQTFFRSLQSVNQASKYIVGNGAKDGIAIWDVSNKIAPRIMSTTKEGVALTFGTQAYESLKEFVVFDHNGLSGPAYRGKVANQNIKANTNVDGIIITAPLFLDQAERLAQFHRNHDGLSVAVVTTRQIYNEFSSGMQDITALRDYLRYVWASGSQLRYALLFGDASYDYKDRLDDKENFVPVYESRESIHRLFSHSSDDYFGFFEEHEGFWYEGDELSNGTRSGSTADQHTMEIGVGRLAVSSVNQAEVVVDKIIRYATSKNTLGKWRTEFVYLADDGDNNTHMKQVDGLNKILESKHPEYTSTKLYLDNFDQPGNKSPAMRRAFIEKISDGALVIDYLGHGGDNELMQEEVIDELMIRKLTNRHKLPLIVTATCQFGVYDKAGDVSGAEEFLRNPNGGAIALITTTRAVYASTNELVNTAFHNSIFQKINGEHPRLGDVIRITKNNSLSGPINRNFALLGDPMLQLNYPDYGIRFTDMENQLDTLSALEEITLSGQVYEDTTILEDFNGTATITVWDTHRTKRTLGLDNPAINGLSGQTNKPHEYDEQDNALFRGEVTVANGQFDVSFVLPKNSSYKYQNGRITAYAYNEYLNIDATGANVNFVIGGTATYNADTQSPSINAYLNEPSFTDGDVVGPSSMFIAELTDDNGINISTNGFSQNLTLTLNDTLQIVLNDFYTASKDDYKSGRIAYPLQNLPSGKYRGVIKVWDVHNNPAQKTVEFNVSDKPRIRLFNVMNYPNPVSNTGETTFSFEHDRSGDALTIVIDVYDTKGTIMNTWKYKVDDAGAQVNDLNEILTNNQGTKLNGGIYFYKMRVQSAVDGALSEVINRLVINN